MKKRFDVFDADVADQNWSIGEIECRAVRHPSLGHWCGYIGLPVGHPMHGNDYDSIDVDVHGGLTYACDHAPLEKPDGRWWIGFDTAHSGDFVPGVDGGKPIGSDTYKDASFVVAETERLAKQAAP